MKVKAHHICGFCGHGIYGKCLTGFVKGRVYFYHLDKKRDCKKASRERGKVEITDGKLPKIIGYTDD